MSSTEARAGCQVPGRQLRLGMLYEIEQGAVFSGKMLFLQGFAGELLSRLIQVPQQARLPADVKREPAEKHHAPHHGNIYCDS